MGETIYYIDKAVSHGILCLCLYFQIEDPGTGITGACSLCPKTAGYLGDLQPCGEWCPLFRLEYKEMAITGSVPFARVPDKLSLLCGHPAVVIKFDE